jgi:transcriptional regulator with GAF, ATPase, and Fis domain
MIERQQFRNDLNARFDFQIEIPSLRDREESERERLIDFAALNPQYNPGTFVDRISRNALDNLSRREYRNGNFRELETVVHTAITKARRRGARCIRTKDLPDQSAPLAVRDNDAYVVNVSQAPEGRMMDVSTMGDIARAATITHSPVLRTPEGNEYVVTSQCVFRYRPDNVTERAT